MLADRSTKAADGRLWKNTHPASQTYRLSSSSTSRGGETFSFFCDSGKQLEILNFLPDAQDLGLTVCRC